VIFGYLQTMSVGAEQVGAILPMYALGHCRETESAQVLISVRRFRMVRINAVFSSDV